MARLLTNIGEEYTAKFDIGVNNVIIGLYNDSTDAIADTDNEAAITTEPGDAGGGTVGNYARQTEAVSVSNINGDWGVDTDTDTVFDTTNTTGTVDSYFVLVNFSSTEAGSTADHLVCTGALSQSYDLGNYTQVTISAGGVGWTLD